MSFCSSDAVGFGTRASVSGVGEGGHWQSPPSRRPAWFCTHASEAPFQPSSRSTGDEIGLNS